MPFELNYDLDFILNSALIYFLFKLNESKMQINDLQLKLEVLQKTLEKKRQNTKFGESSNLLNSTITSSSSSSQLNNSAQIISPSTTTTPTLLKQTSEQPSSNNISNSLDILALNENDNNSKQTDSINARNTVSLDENTTQSNTATVSDCSSSPTLSSTSSTSSSSSSSPQQQQLQQQQLNQQQQLPESTRALNDLPNIINTPKSIKIHKISQNNDENINNDAKSESTS